MKKYNLDLLLLTEEEKEIFEKLKEFQKFLTEKQYKELQKIVYKSLMKNH